MEEIPRRIPKFISAHQPAKNLKAVTHEVAKGIHARVAFAGDIFEMEDQRNWTDASFKTYCTPLEIPYPVEVSKGTKISQKIKITVEGGESRQDLRRLAAKGRNASRVSLRLTDRPSALPLLGVQVSGEVDDLTDKQIERLKGLHLDHLSVDLALSDESFVKDLRRATTQAKALGVSLQVVLGLGEKPCVRHAG